MEGEKKLFFKEGNIEDEDPLVHSILLAEEKRQKEGVNLIASENYTSKGVMQILGASIQNKIAEGYPGSRYFRGCEEVDKIESCAIERALKGFNLDSEKWGANVQPLSGTPTNFAVYTSLIGKDGKIMGLHLPDGGHLSHGFGTKDKHVSATSMYFDSKPYHVDPKTGLIDYDEMEEIALEHRPNIIVAGYSAYPRDLDYARFREVADKVGAYLMVDMSHFWGLVAAKQLANPFEYADIVTTTTHKIMRGPRGGIIFFKKEFESKINFGVFPQSQGAPHVGNIAALAFHLKEFCSERYHEYAVQIVKNSKALAEAMVSKGYTLASGGTDNHLILWNVKPLRLTGGKVEAVLEKFLIYANKNTISGDKSPMNPGGLRIGTPAMTARGMVEEDMLIIADYFEKAVDLSRRIVEKVGTKLADFIDALEWEDHHDEITQIQTEMREYIKKFPIPKSTIV